MLTFNHLLQSEGMEPAVVRLVRHQDNRKPVGERRTTYGLWRAGDGQFELYQALQGHNCTFPVGGYLASFVVTPARETLFVGMYSVLKKGSIKGEIRCPVKGTICKSPGHILYDLAEHPALSAYRGRVVIEWGLGARSWIQRAERQPKQLLEIRASFQEPVFPGFQEFRWNLDELDALPVKWQEVLRASRGVYVLTCLQTGELYVGSAFGDDGFQGRFAQYALDNHGGNVLLKKRSPKPYQLSILETVSSLATPEDVIRRERIWKEKLGSRAFGLNLN